MKKTVKSPVKPKGRRSARGLTALVFLLILACLLSCGCGIAEYLPELPAEEPPVAAATETPSEPEAPGEAPELLKVRFIDVGQADSILIRLGDAAMLIDGGNVGDSDVVYTVLKNEGVETLDYVVCTHAHEDHVGGLAGALNACAVGAALCPVSSYDSKAFGNFKKYVEAQGLELERPEAGESFYLGSALVEVLGPVKDYDDANNTSIVLRLTYGESRFLFTGDAESEAEHDILDAGFDVSADVLKVGHHGSSTSSSYVFLREVMPSLAVVSVGEGNSYGHPDEGTLSRLNDAGAEVLRTDELGDIVLLSDGKSVWVEG